MQVPARGPLRYHCVQYLWCKTIRLNHAWEVLMCVISTPVKPSAAAPDSMLNWRPLLNANHNKNSG